MKADIDKIKEKLGWSKVAENINNDGEILVIFNKWGSKGFDVEFANGSVWVKKQSISKRLKTKVSGSCMNKRPNIPLRRVSKAESGLTNLLYITSIACLFGSIFIPLCRILWMPLLVICSGLRLRTNLQDAFRKENLKNGLKFVPINLCVLFVGAILLELSGIKLFDMVISFNSLFGQIPTVIETARVISLDLVLNIVYICGLCVVFNYFEEFYFREDFELFGRKWSGWLLVIVWVFIHLFLGLSIFTIGSLILLALDGIIFKLIFDRYGVQVSYINHLFRNIFAQVIWLILLTI